MAALLADLADNMAELGLRMGLGFLLAGKNLPIILHSSLSNVLPRPWWADRQPYNWRSLNQQLYLVEASCLQWSKYYATICPPSRDTYMIILQVLLLTGTFCFFIVDILLHRRKEENVNAANIEAEGPGPAL
jgi:hypothetical protein